MEADVAATARARHSTLRPCSTNMAWPTPTLPSESTVLAPTTPPPARTLDSVNCVDMLRALSNYASGQWGMVTTPQANAAGVPEADQHRLEAAGLLTPVGWGVYALLAASPRHADIKAAWLATATPPSGYAEVISHSSAAALHELGDLQPDTVDITTPRDLSRPALPGIRLRQAQIPDNDVIHLDGIPATNVERTIADLAAANLDGGHLGTMLADAHQQGRIDLQRIAARLAAHAEQYGVSPGPAAGQHLVDVLLATVGYRQQDRLTAEITRRIPRLSEQQTLHIARTLGLL